MTQDDDKLREMLAGFVKMASKAAQDTYTQLENFTAPASRYLDAVAAPARSLVNDLIAPTRSFVDAIQEPTGEFVKRRPTNEDLEFVDSVARLGNEGWKVGLRLVDRVLTNPDLGNDELQRVMGSSAELVLRALRGAVGPGTSGERATVQRVQLRPEAVANAKGKGKGKGSDRATGSAWLVNHGAEPLRVKIESGHIYSTSDSLPISVTDEDGKPLGASVSIPARGSLELRIAADLRQAKPVVYGGIVNASHRDLSSAIVVELDNRTSAKRTASKPTTARPATAQSRKR